MSAKIADLRIGIKNQGEDAVADLQNLANALKIINRTKNSLDFSSVSKQGASGLQILYKRVQSITRIMKPLADQMERISNGFSALSHAKSIAKEIATTGKTNEAITDTSNMLPVKPAVSETATAEATVPTKIQAPQIEGGDALPKMSTSMVEVGSKVELLTQKLEILKQKYIELSADPSKVAQTNAVAIQIRNTEDAIEKANRLATANNNLAKSNQKVATTSNKASAETKKMANNLKTTSLASSLAHTGIGKLVSQFGRLLKLKAMRMIVMGFYKAIGEGISNLYEYSKALDSIDGANFSETMNQYKSLALQLKNTVATALAPVLNAILPLVQKFVEYVIIAINAIARFFAFLNNQPTYTVAKNVAVQWAEDAKNSAGGASDAIKELQRTILGFDELNVLNSPDRSSGGGGGGAGGSSVNASDMFEERETGQLTGIWEKLANWASTLKKDAEIIWGWVKKIVDKLVASGVIDAIVDTIDGIISTVDEVLTRLDNWGVLDEMADAIGDIAKAVAEIADSTLIKAILDSSLTNAVIILKDVLVIIADALGVVSSILNGDFGGALRKFGTLIIDIFTLVADSIYSIVEGLVATFYGLYKTIGNGIADIVEKAGWEDKAEEIRQMVNAHADGIMDSVHQVADDIDASSQRTKMAWEILFDGGLELARAFSDNAKNLSSDIVEDIYRAWQDGRYKIEKNKIVFDINADGVFESFFDINGGYEVLSEELKTETDEIVSHMIDGFGGAGRSFDETIDGMIDGFGGAGRSFDETVDGMIDGFGGAGRSFDETVDEMGKKWDTTTFNAKAPSIDPALAYKIMNEMVKTWNNKNFPAKGLTATNNVGAAVNEAYNTWAGKNFGSKVLEATTGKFTGAIDGIVKYWNNTSFKAKGITAYVNLPKGTSVSYYAQGGMVDEGSLFIAGEAGAEMVGNINGRTGVASQDEITGIRQSVESTGNTEARLLAEQNALLRQILAKEGNVTVSTSAIIDGLNRTNRRAGKTVVSMG